MRLWYITNIRWNSPWLIFKIYYISKIFGKSLIPSAKTAVIGVDKTLIFSCLLFERLRGLCLHHIFTCNGHCHCLKAVWKSILLISFPVLKISLGQHIFNIWWYIFFNFLDFFASTHGQKTHHLCASLQHF